MCDDQYTSSGSGFLSELSLPQDIDMCNVSVGIGYGLNGTDQLNGHLK